MQYAVLSNSQFVSRYDSSSISVFAFWGDFSTPKCRHDDDDDDDDDTETPDPVQAQIPSHPGIKYPVRGIPSSDHIPRLRQIGGRDSPHVYGISINI